MQHRKPPVIKTTRLTLRSMTDRDADRAAAILTHEEVGKTFMVPDFKSRDEVLNLFAALKRLSLAEDRFVYGIYREDVLIGFLNDVEMTETEMELGLVIHPDHKSRGYASEALSAAISALFDLGYAAVKTGVFEENAASRRVMEKCGMTRLDEVSELEYRGITHRCLWFEYRNPADEPIRRIQHMEQIFDRANGALRALSDLLPQVEELHSYYCGGQWRKDYEADEAGLLPADLKRGVLAQDTLYDFFAAYDRLIRESACVLHPEPPCD